MKADFTHMPKAGQSAGGEPAVDRLPSCHSAHVEPPARRALPLLVPLLLITASAGCSGEKTGEVTVETTLHLCRQQECRDLPAAGAEVTFFAGGSEVGTATLDDAGRITKTFGPGTYTVDVSMPEFGLHITQDQVNPTSLDADGGVTFDLAFPDTLNLTAVAS